MAEPPIPSIGAPTAPQDVESALRLLKSADQSLAIKALQALETASSKDRHIRDALRRCRLLVEGNAFNAKLPVVQDPQRLSGLLFPVGTVSTDGNAVLGHHGYVYLTEGTNFVLSRYDRPRASSEAIARAERQARAGRKFLHFTVPEKISTLPGNLGFDLKTPTDVLAIVEDRFRTNPADALVLSVLDEFRGREEQCVTRLDSHQSIYGSFLITRMVARALGSHAFDDITFTAAAVRSGDLAFRFFSTPMYEVIPTPDVGVNPVLRNVPKRIALHEPGDGGHLGIRVIWRNDDAPLKMRAVAFGNSCFERGGEGLLSWWFARLFQDFHFVWSNVVDDGYADSVNADLVIAQTMERFLFARFPEA
jgi:hypothetical protein